MLEKENQVQGPIFLRQVEIAKKDRLELSRSNTGVTLKGATYFKRILDNILQESLPDSELKNAFINQNTQVYSYRYITRSETQKLNRSPLGITHVSYANMREAWSIINQYGSDIFSTDGRFYEGSDDIKFLVPRDGYEYSIALIGVNTKFNLNRNLTARDALVEGPGILVIKWV